ncbi:MAG: pyridoxamine 5'-phosphate oxidase [Flavobacteriaceae bacterium]
MEKDLSNYRKSYEKGDLIETEVSGDAMELFQRWFHEIEEFSPEVENNAMTVSSIGLDGFPKNRVVLLKKFTWEGFIFYSNYESEKGKAMEVNNHVCASFFWPSLERQVIIKGRVEKIPENLSDGYFESRPDGSKLGAWASDQSKVVPSRAYLDQRLKSFEEKYKNIEIPRPEHWGGYLIRPESIEFWQGRPNRMHDRLRYSLDQEYNWNIERLAP